LILTNPPEPDSLKAKGRCCMTRFSILLVVLLAACSSTQGNGFDDAGPDAADTASETQDGAVDTAADSGVGTDTEPVDTVSDTETTTDSDTVTSSSGDSDGDSDSVSDTASDSDADADSDGDSDSDGDGDTDATGYWVDPNTGYQWENPPHFEGPWQGAVDYCQNLVLGGFDNWILPTVSDLTKVMRGCDEIKTGCKVKDPGCLKASCWTESCSSYPYYPSPTCKGGPGVHHTYCDPAWTFVEDEIPGKFYYDTWSRSVVADNLDNAWLWGFYAGTMRVTDKTNPHTVIARCVRYYSL
jgi:hypothetical protein